MIYFTLQFIYDLEGLGDLPMNDSGSTRKEVKLVFKYKQKLCKDNTVLKRVLGGFKMDLCFSNLRHTLT